MIFHGNLLHAEIFFACYRKPGSGLYRLIIGNNNTLPAANISNTCNCTPCGATSLLFIHFVSRKRPYFNKRFIFIAQVSNAFSRNQFVFFLLFFSCLFPSSFIYLFQLLLYLAPA